ncbi:MAG: hypothetical protein ACK4YP_14280 [Myxococcota bacterium]
MSFYRRLLVMVTLLVTVFGLARAADPATPTGAAAAPASVVAPAVHSADRPISIRTLADAEKVQDPRALYRAADVHRDGGDTALARALYEKGIDAEELALYLRYSPDLREALVLERLGDMPGAEERRHTSTQKEGM